MKKSWIEVLRVFAKMWFVVAGMLIAIGLVTISVREGFDVLLQVLSPFNVNNFIAVLVTLLPAIGAKLFADRLEKRRQ